MKVDHIIVGQGISGSLLGLRLQSLGKKVMVVDNRAPASSSNVASGIINPVTGKRLVRSWMTEQLVPFAWDTYTRLSAEWNVPLIKHCSILDMHMTHESRDLFADKLVSEKEYLSEAGDEEKWKQYFRFNYGIGQIAPCLLLDIQTLLTKSREVLSAKDALLEETFCIDDLIVNEEGVTYKNVKGEKILFCDGVAAADNPYFNRLPWSKDKGEAIIVSIPGLPAENIYKQGINIVPWHDGLFWVGASHDWKFTDLAPTEAFRKRAEEQLSYWLKLPYTIIDHIVAQRPANLDRKPFVGLHPVHPSVGIFNGMGSKGCSVAPYFADQLARHLVQGVAISGDVDVRRFERLLSRM